MITYSYNHSTYWKKIKIRIVFQKRCPYQTSLSFFKNQGSYMIRPKSIHDNYKLEECESQIALSSFWALCHSCPLFAKTIWSCMWILAEYRNKQEEPNDYNEQVKCAELTSWQQSSSFSLMIIRSRNWICFTFLSKGKKRIWCK